MIGKVDETLSSAMLWLFPLKLITIDILQKNRVPAYNSYIVIITTITTFICLHLGLIGSVYEHGSRQK